MGDTRGFGLENLALAERPEPGPGEVVVEVGGPDTFNGSLSAVRVGGGICMIGVLTGIRGEVNTALILRKGIRVQGIYVGSRAMFEAMKRAIS